MDRETAQGIFKSQILARWPDFDVTTALFDDWINFITKYTPDDICRAAGQYVLNYDAFKRPSLSKFRELINIITISSKVEKAKEEKWPQYFLQQDEPDCISPGYGTLVELGHICDDPACAKSIAEYWLERYETRFKMDYKLVTCNDLEQRCMLLADRSKKNRPDLLKGNNNERNNKPTNPKTFTTEFGKIKDSSSSKDF